MDCPSEEQLIRMKLEGFSTIEDLNFDIPNRKLSVFYTGQIDSIEKSIEELNLGSSKLTTQETDPIVFKENTQQKNCSGVFL